MEIRIRYVKPHVVKEIDEKAKKLNLTRQTYLKNLIDNHFLVNDLNDRERELKNTLDKNTEVIKIMGEKLEENTKVLNYLLEE